MHFVQRTGIRGVEKKVASVNEKREFYFLF